MRLHILFFRVYASEKMVLIPKVLRTCGLILFILVNVHALVNAPTKPWIVSFKVVEKSCVENNCKYLLNVRGGQFLGHYSWRLTPSEALRGGSCDVISSSYELRKVKTEEWITEIEVTIPNHDGKTYFCLHDSEGKFNPFGGEWVHQGTELFLDPKSDEASQNVAKSSTDLQQAQQWDLSHDTDINYLPNTPTHKKDIEILKTKEIESNLIRRKRNIIDANQRSKRNVTVTDTTTKADMEFYNVKTDWGKIKIDGLRVEEGDKDPKIANGVPSVLADSKFKLRLFGQGFTPRTVIAFTEEPLEYDQPCKFLVKNGEYMVIPESIEKDHASALFEVIAPAHITDGHLYICAKNLRPGISSPAKDKENHYHQGTELWKRVAIHQKLLPLWVSLTLILICLTFSALFSGLNLGLMSLDRTELKIISNTGTEQERKYARAIMPVRDHGNYLLCSILLGNVAVNSTFTILLDELTSGLFAVIFSTLAIVLLGEITPQAICSRHGLMVGAKSIVITKGVMALTAPLAFPVSKILDYLLGEEIGNVYNRERLKELVKVTTEMNDLDKDEVNIISGALELRKKTVSDVMTKLEDVFMLPITSVLDFETMSEIVKSGYSRIPVYEGHRGNIVTVLFIKDLAFVDPDDNTPLRTLAQYYQNPCNFVFEDVTLDVMFKQFKDGHKGHMAFVHRINNEGEGDPFYETVGLVTLEDVIEEMIQSEIVDETDVFMDNRTKRRRNKPTNKLQDFAAFAERHENQRTHISPQLTLATFQFLSSSVEAFRPDTVSETVLRRLLKQDVIHHIKLKGKSKKDSSTYVYQQGKPVDYFVLILEGRVEVTVGRENLVFEAGPFTYFGVQALTQNIGVAESPTPSAMGSLQNINMDSMLRHTFVPDYSVRATTELFYLTVKRALYLAAKRATLMEKGALSKGATNDQLDNELDKLLQSVDEDISISGEHKTPSRQVSPNPLPVSASPHTRSSFAPGQTSAPPNGTGTT
ncbi:unextended protein-like [Leguminivora glycinivorella]|uniref:unextended protein-like n=1 Tax=Leguminivora glycinivorella TaxID=1035111 RepID=UPI00200C551E|nr:unextended protein-like [Leguminivora glycinivorella]